MPLPEQPGLAIFPIMTFEAESGTPVDFLGTGFFIDESGTFMTARHVFTDYGVGNFSNARRPVIVRSDLAVFNVIDVVMDAKHDIATAAVRPKPEDVVSLEIAEAQPGLNLDVVAWEYSRTVRAASVGGGPSRPRYNITPRSRKGNLVSAYSSDYPGPATAQVFELSFPALKGASGAPVMLADTGSVVAMIINNVESELAPTQIIRYEEKGELKEEIRYLLPAGEAISWIHLREAIEARPHRTTL